MANCDLKLVDPGYELRKQEFYRQVSAQNWAIEASSLLQDQPDNDLNNDQIGQSVSLDDKNSENISYSKILDKAVNQVKFFSHLSLDLNSKPIKQSESAPN